MIFSIREISGTIALIDPPSGYKKIVAGVGPSSFFVNSGTDFNNNLISEYTSSKFDLSDTVGWTRPF